MKAKKLFSMVLAGAAAVSLLAGCSSDAGSTENGAEATVQSEAQDTQSDADGAQDTSVDVETDDGADEASASGNVLVVYYSATGNTEEAANMIADATGGDLFELEPVEPYTDDDLNYGDENSRVSQEYADESLRDVELVSTTVEVFEEYDTVFIGYPIWWQVAAWPVDSFVENNDFTGKTVVPF